ncbi:hypothetical protein NUSPORA_01023 [Nucleospora cyclopteri]
MIISLSLISKIYTSEYEIKDDLIENQVSTNKSAQCTSGGSTNNVIFYKNWNPNDFMTNACQSKSSLPFIKSLNLNENGTKSINKNNLELNTIEQLNLFDEVFKKYERNTNVLDKNDNFNLSIEDAEEFVTEIMDSERVLSGNSDYVSLTPQRNTVPLLSIPSTLPPLKDQNDCIQEKDSSQQILQILTECITLSNLEIEHLNSPIIDCDYFKNMCFQINYLLYSEFSLFKSYTQNQRLGDLKRIYLQNNSELQNTLQSIKEPHLSTSNEEPSFVDLQPFQDNSEPSTSSEQHSTSSKYPSFVDLQQFQDNSEPSTSSEQHSTSSKHPSFVDLQPFQDDSQPSTSSKHPSFDDLQQFQDDSQPSTSSKHPSFVDLQPFQDDSQPSTSSKHPSFVDLSPFQDDSQPSTSNRQSLLTIYEFSSPHVKQLFEGEIAHQKNNSDFYEDQTNEQKCKTGFVEENKQLKKIEKSIIPCKKLELTQNSHETQNSSSDKDKFFEAITDLHVNTKNSNFEEDESEDLSFLSSSSLSEENENENLSFSSDSSLPEKSDSFYLRKRFWVHKDASLNHILNSEIHFFRNEHLIFPKEFSFSPGWNKHKLTNQYINKADKKRSSFIKICQDYGLKHYFGLILKMIQMNTYTKDTQNTPLDVCFHLICFHLCTKHNLGYGFFAKVDKKYHCHNLINNKRYCQVFKSKKYWNKKAEKLYEQTKLKVNAKFGISTSSLMANHLYNILTLLPYKNSNKIAFVFYVYYATDESELNQRTYGLSFSESQKVISRQKKIFKVTKRFRKMFICAFKVFQKYKHHNK